ncbi:DNA repair protein SWI5 homolog isoform X2 [Melanerpes formicivorus]|uniref:DNA repair protein SWI5 homolog isoform X2 n=1 Tax=Melanerpes formicivorus TaxID=211600 RepID=UPI00358E755A
MSPWALLQAEQPQRSQPAFKGRRLPATASLLRPLRPRPHKQVPVPVRRAPELHAALQLGSQQGRGAGALPPPAATLLGMQDNCVLPRDNVPCSSARRASLPRAAGSAGPCRGNYGSRRAARRGAGPGRAAAALAEGISPGAGTGPPRQPPPRALHGRTSGGGRQSGTVGFKFPIPSPRSCQPNGASEEALRCEIEELKQKDLALDQEITQLLSEYVLGNLSVHCDTSMTFSDSEENTVQELELKAELL